MGAAARSAHTWIRQCAVVCCSFVTVSYPFRPAYPMIPGDCQMIIRFLSECMPTVQQRTEDAASKQRRPSIDLPFRPPMRASSTGTGWSHITLRAGPAASRRLVRFLCWRDRCGRRLPMRFTASLRRHRYGHVTQATTLTWPARPGRGPSREQRRHQSVVRPSRPIREPRHSSWTWVMGIFSFSCTDSFHSRNSFSTTPLSFDGSPPIVYTYLRLSHIFWDFSRSSALFTSYSFLSLIFGYTVQMTVLVSTAYAKIVS